MLQETDSEETVKSNVSKDNQVQRRQLNLTKEEEQKNQGSIRRRKKIKERNKYAKNTRIFLKRNKD